MSLMGPIATAKRRVPATATSLEQTCNENENRNTDWESADLSGPVVRAKLELVLYAWNAV